MGYIYKITNKINNKVYIGQTSRTIEIRWKEHKKNINSLCDRLPLYKALKKYGVDNFTIEEIDECENSLLDEREIYWIHYYNSFSKENGYNCTSGGKGINIVATYEIDLEEINARYLKGERLDLLCKEFHHDYMTVRRELLKRGTQINTLGGPKKVSKQVRAINPKTKEIVKQYESISAAARDICEEGKNFKAIGNHISKYKNMGIVSHGFIWETIEKELN